MPLVNLETTTAAKEDVTRRDMLKVQNAINSQQSIMDLESRTSDPSLTGTTGKIQVWYRRDLKELRFNDNGTTYKIAATAA